MTPTRLVEGQPRRGTDTQKTIPRNARSLELWAELQMPVGTDTAAVVPERCQRPPERPVLLDALAGARCAAGANASFCELNSGALHLPTSLLIRLLQEKLSSTCGRKL